MVEKIDKEGRALYKCGECGFHYASEDKANECEEWDREYKSCNLDITKESEEGKHNV